MARPTPVTLICDNALAPSVKVIIGLGGWSRVEVTAPVQPDAAFLAARLGEAATMLRAVGRLGAPRVRVAGPDAPEPADGLAAVLGEAADAAWLAVPAAGAGGLLRPTSLRAAAAPAAAPAAAVPAAPAAEAPAVLAAPAEAAAAVRSYVEAHGAAPSFRMPNSKAWNYIRSVLGVPHADPEWVEAVRRRLA